MLVGNGKILNKKCMYLYNFFFLYRMINMMSKIKLDVNMGFLVDYRIFCFGFSEYVGFFSFGKK